MRFDLPLLLRALLGAALYLALVPTLAPGRADAQGPFDFPRPGDERPELEDYPSPPEAEPRLELPPVPLGPTDTGELSLAPRVYVARFEFAGNRAFTSDELARVVAPYAGRPIRSEELLLARDAVTRHYVDAGYVTSGAVVPDQSVDDGVVRIVVIEGRLEGVRVEGTRRFRTSFFTGRIERGDPGPVNVYELEERLQLLQRDPRVERLHARLEPGELLGESFLTLAVEERRPWELRAEGTNEHTPSIGENGGGLGLAFHNVVGWGDTLSARFDRTEGLRDLELSYALPFTPWDTTLELGYRTSESDVVTSDLDPLDFVSDYTAYRVTLSHPFVRTPRQEIRFGITGERRKSETFIFEDEPISLAPGSEDGETVVTAVRVFQEWTRRTARHVIAARSTFSLGLDALGASNAPDLLDGTETPDGRFFAWLAQAQYARRLPELFGREPQLIVRGDLQWAGDRLPSLEKYAIGGLSTVRGYHENELVRDSGAVGSLELRLPLWRDALGLSILELAPFFDVGRAWDVGGRFAASGDESLKTLASLGLGLRYRPTRGLLAEVYWGSRLRQVDDRGSGAQNHGWHFRLTAQTF